MTLTPDEWPYVLDALGAAVAELNEKAEMWKGRTRYWQEPHVGSLWPDENEAEFGYPVGDVGIRRKS